MLTLAIVVLVVLLGSAICSASEIAILSVSRIRARQLAQTRKRDARVLLQIRESVNRPIATIVILNNVFNIVGSIVIGRLAAAVLDNLWLGIFSAIVTFLIIIFGEILPKTLGERYSEVIALRMALPIAGITILFSPLVWLLEHLTEPFTRGKKRPTTNEAEIQLLVNIGRQEGMIEANEAEMVQRVFRLNDMTAGNLMSPRTTITYLHGEQTLEEAKWDIIVSQHTRILIVEETLDEVLGFVLKDELLTAIVDGRGNWKIADLTREVSFVPESIRADKLLALFQASRKHLVVVVDEYGDVAGVVTLEDVIEVLTGEIVDETDRSIDLQELARQRLKKMLQRQNFPSL